MPISQNDLLEKLKISFPGSDIEIKDLAGDNDHFHATICAKEFIGKTRIQQHQMVYKALGDIAGGALHALALTTKIPD
jgi:stress-induced morphogen